MNVGVIGCGAVAVYCHLPALRRIAGVRVVAVADPDPRALTRLGSSSTMARHTSPEELLGRPDVRAVVITVPPAHHADVALASIRAGKAIYLEKPISLTLADAGAIAAAAAAGGIESAIGFNRRAHPLYQQARRLIVDGAIGSVRFVQMAFCEPEPPAGLPVWKRTRADGGGALLDLASHHVDLLRWFLGREVTEVSATTTSEASEQDGAVLRLTMAGGVEASGVYSFRSGYADHLEFLGDRGSLRVDRHRAALGLRRSRERGYGPRTVRPWPTREVARWWARRLIRRSEDPSYFHALRSFVRQVDGGPHHLATLDDGRRSLAVVLAAEASVLRGAPVTPGA